MLTITRLTKFGLVNFVRNLWLNLLATFVMSLTLMIITVLLISAFFVQSEIKNIESKIDFEIYLNDGTTDDKIDVLKQAITNTVEVSEMKLITKEEAVERYKEIFGDREKLITYIEQENALKQSLIVKTNNPDDLEKVSKVVNESDFKDLIYSSSYSRNRDIIVKLMGVIDFVQKAGILIGLLFIFIAVAVVFSTVRIAIYSRKDEIEIMKLVGATDWFVHAPFLIESGLFGVFAAIFSTIMVSTVGYYMSLIAQSYLGVSGDFFGQFVDKYLLFIIVFQLLLGVTISVASAFVAIRNHLK
ncbi:MAG TPA: permease-like cell division protein FtsX [bacterium]|nr:permease-like cell division protein FtsX [bacterium]